MFFVFLTACTQKHIWHNNSDLNICKMGRIPKGWSRKPKGIHLNILKISLISEWLYSNNAVSFFFYAAALDIWKRVENHKEGTDQKQPVGGGAKGRGRRKEDSQLSSCMVQVWMSIGKFFKSIGQERVRVSLRWKKQIGKREEEQKGTSKAQKRVWEGGRHRNTKRRVNGLRESWRRGAAGCFVWKLQSATMQ